MGIDQPKVSALLNGRLTNFSSQRLMRLLTALATDVEIVVKAKPRTRQVGKVQVKGLAVSTHVTLADATDLVAWSSRQDSRSGLPLLIRRLVLGSVPSLTKISVRSGEGIDIGGWDGVTGCQVGNAYVPERGAGWEVSVRADVKQKADEDYDGRCNDPDGLQPSDTAFIFVTSRRWPRKRRWATERAKEGRWRSVSVLDADDLETWLELVPAVHAWFSRAVGKQPEDTVDLETFWSDWSEVTRPETTSAFLLAGREKAVEHIQQELRGKAQSFSVKAESPEEALAVFIASVRALPELENSLYLTRTCTASGFLDSGLTVFASTPPRPARGGRAAPGPGFGSRTSPASTARCTSA